MDQKKQHAVSIVIGLVLAGLLVYIGVRVVQQRSSQASLPENLTATRLDADTCTVSATTKTDEPLLLKYGETAATFYFRMEPSNIQPQSDGTYLQEADINNISSGKMMFILESDENIQTTCEAFVEEQPQAADESESTASNLDSTAADVPESTQSEPEIIDSTDEESTAVPTPTESESSSSSSDGLEKTALTRDLADAYFDENPNADFTGCVEEFKADYYALIQVCNEAWRNK